MTFEEILNRLKQPIDPPRVASNEQETQSRAPPEPEPPVVEEEIISTEEGEVEEKLADNEVVYLERNNPQF